MANPNIQSVTSFPTPLSSTCTLLQGDGTGFVILAKCTGTIPTTADTFQVGCIMVKSDATAGTSANYENTGTTAAPVWSPFSASNLAGGTAYVKDNANGANNAIAVSYFTTGTTKVAITTGTRVAIELTHTLQKGANTININGTTASLKNSTNLLNITTGYVVGGVIEVMYLAGVQTGIFVDLKQ